MGEGIWLFLNTALALEVTPTTLPDEPVLAWSRTADGASTIHVIPLSALGSDAESMVLATHDAELHPAALLTDRIALMASGDRLWWVHLPDGEVTELPRGFVHRLTERDRATFQDAEGHVWTTPLTPVPTLGDLGAHDAVLGSLGGQLLLSTGDVLTEHPSGRTSPLAMPVPVGSVGWVPVGSGGIHVQFPDGRGLVFAWGQPSKVRSDAPAPRPIATPRVDLVSTHRKLKADGRMVDKGHLGTAVWWLPANGRWGPGTVTAMERPPSGLCIEQTGPAPSMRCSSGGRSTIFDQRSITVDEVALSCPEGRWLSGSRYASTSSGLDGWWCVDDHLRRDGDALFRTEDGGLDRRHYDAGAVTP